MDLTIINRSGTDYDIHVISISLKKKKKWVSERVEKAPLSFRHLKIVSLTLNEVAEPPQWRNILEIAFPKHFTMKITQQKCE